MSSFLKKAFGWLGAGDDGDDPATKSSRAVAGKAGRTESYKECTIAPTPMREGNQWRVAGLITKEIDGEVFERSFVRADLFPSADQAEDFTLRKARQIIDQSGPRLFSGERKGTA